MRALFRVAGKNQGKVIAVFAISDPDARRAVRYLGDAAPDVPVWLFSLESPARRPRRFASACTSGTIQRGYCFWQNGCYGRDVWHLAQPHGAASQAIGPSKVRLF